MVFYQKRWDYSEFDDVFQHGARVCHEYAMGYRPACAPFFQLPFSFADAAAAAAAADLFSTLADYRTGNPFMSILTVTAHIVPY